MALNNGRKKRKKRRIRNPRLRFLIAAACLLLAAGIIYLGLRTVTHNFGRNKTAAAAAETESVEIIPLTEETENTESLSEQETESEEVSGTETETVTETESEEVQAGTGEVTSETITWNDSWEYADHSKAHGSSVTLYHSGAVNRNGIVIAVNAGHGSQSAAGVKTLCHPDGTAKVTGGSTSEGSTTATGANSGTTLTDGTSEASANLAMAKILKDTLLEKGYDVLMIREADDCDLDNIARTVYANNNAACHIALHYDAGTSDKGLYYTSVPDIASYRSMEPVASHYQEHIALGEALVDGEEAAGVKIFGSGSLAVDLTQTSYSTVPSVDLEIGDQATSHDASYHQSVANGIVLGLDQYFGITRNE